MTIFELFEAAKKNNASDIHLLIHHPPIFRINGVLTTYGKTLLTAESCQILIYSILTPEQQQTFESKKELDFSYELNDNSRFRLNILYEKGAVSLVARLISSKIPKPAEITLPPITNQLIQLTHGLVLVTGPTGCGKSTTLASVLNEINLHQRRHILTLEDPIEFIYPKEGTSIVRQRQLGTDMLSFAEGLKHALRQDPDVILIGEMRDLETISAAITFAETGHLVFATLHTLNAAQTIDRIIDVFPPYQQNQVRIQLSISLEAIISQELITKKDETRVAAREILLNNSAVANLIRRNKIPQINNVIQTSAELGMATLKQDIKRLVAENKLDAETAQKYLETPGTN